ncbi:Uncharacterised protein [Mycobacteroides abscessus subsp. massiliense]|nr:Uncharacterised protein [Mycobacteroides abscessus subsp. massiliense]
MKAPTGVTRGSSFALKKTGVLPAESIMPAVCRSAPVYMLRNLIMRNGTPFKPIRSDT